MRAYAAGLIDFSKSRFEDPAWWRRLRFILDELGDQTDRDYVKFKHRHSLALVGSIPDNNLNIQFLKDAADAYDAVTKRIYPWHDNTAVEKREHEAIAEQYNTAVGDMNDPAYRQQVNLLVEELNQRRLSALQSNKEREEEARKLALSRVKPRTRNRKR
jgi:hypothetical protein